MAIELFNEGFSKQYLALDPTVSTGYGLRAAFSSDTPLQFTVSDTTATLLRFSTTVSGTTLCLDVYGNEDTVVHLATCGNYLGQQWWWTQESGAAKLSNNYTGSGWYLDVYSDTKQAFMSSGDYSGQYWQQVAVNAVAETAPGTTTGATTGTPNGATTVTTHSQTSPTTAVNQAQQTTLVSGTSTSSIEPATSLAHSLSTESASSQGQSLSTSSASSISTPKSDSTVSTGLSTGAKAGIGVGAALGGLIAILLVVLIFVLRKRKESPQTDPHDEPAVYLGQGPAVHEARYELGNGETKVAAGNTAVELPRAYPYPQPVAELNTRPR